MFFLLKLLKFFVEKNLVVATSALCLYKITEHLFDFNSNYISYFIFFSTLCAYSYMAQFQKLNINHSILSNKSNTLLSSKSIFLLSAFITSCLLFILNFKLLILITPVIIICLLYPVKFQLYNTIICIRSIPYLKIILISLVWSYMTMLMPILYFSYEINHVVIDFFFQRFLFILVIAIPFDMRDMNIDTIKTIPNVFGINNSKKLAFFCLLIIELLLIINVISKVISLNLFLALFLTIELTSLVIYFSHNKKSLIFYGIIVEGLSIIMCLFVIISDLF